MNRDLEYSVLDVFAERAFEGNALAVFHDGRGLSDEDMQALARETNLSETTFVFPGEPEADRRDGVRVRIFTTTEELPFAGHPTLGTASWLHLNHPAVMGRSEVTLQLKVGPIRVRFQPPDERAGIVGSMRQNDPVFGERFDPAEVARILAVDENDLLPGHAPQSVSTGNAFCIVALRSVAALERLAIPQQTSVPWLRERGIRWFYVIAPQQPDALQPVWQARMQWAAGEDPATGSAAGPCIAWLVAEGLAPTAQETVLMQGLQIQRPSRILARASINGGRVHDIDIAGRTIPVATGRYLAPLSD